MSRLPPISTPTVTLLPYTTLFRSLSNLSQCAGVVLAPKRAQVFRQIEFIRLSEKRVLLIIVTPYGDVQNRILFVGRDYLEQELIEASNFFNQHFAGMSFEQAIGRASCRERVCQYV